MIFLYISIFIISCLILSFSGTWIVKSLVRIAQFFRLREFIVASLLMAFATSLPELFVGISSALHGKPELSFGDVIGSNILVLTLVMGIGALMAKGLRFRGRVLQKSSFYAALIAPLPLLLLLDGKISRWDGIILLTVLGFYFYRLLSQEKKFTRIFSNTFKREWVRFRLFLKDFGMFFLSICLLLISAEGIVFSALNLAKNLDLPLVITGVLLVALGTSIPEITFGIKSITMGHKEMILGDAIGSVVVNSTLVLGLVALICPFEITNFSPYLMGILFTVVVASVFAIFAKTEQKITKKEAMFLLLIYIVFVVVEILTMG